jgi:SAM-dependent methyltransferase
MRAGKERPRLFGRLRERWFGKRPSPPPERLSKTIVGEMPVRIEPPVDRLEILQRIWGSGFVLPGGTEYLMRLVTPLAIDSSMSLLDLTAGLGASPRHVVKSFGAYVTALERRVDLAERGQALSVAANLGKQVPIRHFDPETVEFRPKSFDAAYCQMLTSAVADKERLFREIRRGLKPRGQVAFVDVMLRDGEPTDHRISSLHHMTGGKLNLWRLRQYIDCLNNAGFDCRALEDQTDLFRTYVLRGWRDVLKGDGVRGMRKRDLIALFEEAELWFRHVAAMDVGLIGVTRIHAIVR